MQTQHISAYAFGDGCRAPEQVDPDFGKQGTHTDVWGFAACMLHLATNQMPYHDLTMVQMVSAMVKQRAPKPPGGWPAGLQQALGQCFSFDAASRPSVPQLQQVRTWMTSGQ